MIKVGVSLPGSKPAEFNLAVFSYENAKRPEGAFLFGSALDAAFAIAKSDGFEGKSGQMETVRPRSGTLTRVFFIGLGKESEADLEGFRKALGACTKKALAVGIKSFFVRPPLLAAPALMAQAAVEAIHMASYRYTAFKSLPEKKIKLQQATLLAKDAAEAKHFSQGIRVGDSVGNAITFVRDLVNRPPSDTTPELLANTAKKLAKGRVTVKVFNKGQIEKMGMGALLGVNRGSHKPPYFLHLIYKPAGKPKRKIGICGKGITFDSGGLSLKPAASMETMKYDMTGAATVISLFQALPQLNPPVEVHGFTPLTENMPGGNAVKPGDVLKTMKGKTIEVLNTDAEGRLVLADAISYACRQNLDELLDIATLTGACVIALGNSIVGLMGTDSKLLDRLKSASRLAGEKMWELPLEKEYKTLIKSPVADMKNIGPVGQAGTIIGGLFLEEFVDSGLPWAHLDIASTGWTNTATALSEPGSTGVMVRTLLTYLTSYN